MLLSMSNKAELGISDLGLGYCGGMPRRGYCGKSISPFALFIVAWDSGRARKIWRGLAEEGGIAKAALRIGYL
ncbi:uncharacterized protein G2W53_012314 [Senna tora]|uniref:Uncharacterized protein n=1 Tax=Senna tora TaxID=362788 RepID=A0A834U0H1_9FABA|nr:uncharacterized protein G2W53_012314 [Senna tora]